MYSPFGIAAPLAPKSKPLPDLRKALRDNAPKFGGWNVKPKRWKNPHGEDWYGLYGEAPIENVPFLNTLMGYR